MVSQWLKRMWTAGLTVLLTAAISLATPVASDSFDYPTSGGGLNTQSGGSGFGGAWTAVTNQASPALSAGSMEYASGGSALITAGNKLQPLGTSRSTRNFSSTLATANQTYWVSFRINQTGSGTLPSNHAGFSLFSAAAGSGTEIFLGKSANATNWGMYHSGTGGSAQRTGDVTSTGGRDALVLYKLVFTSTNVTVSLWVNPSLASEPSTGTAHATLSATHSSAIASLRISTGGNASGFQFDEFRMGTAFADVTPASILYAYDGFDYTGTLNGQNTGSGFGSAWGAMINNPALATGSMPYTSGGNALTTAGNKLQPAANNRSYRNFSNSIATANQTLWVTFRINQTGSGTLPSNHSGFSLFSGTGATGTELFLGKPASRTNWGMYHSGSGTDAQRTGDVTATGGRDALLVYKLVFASGQLNAYLWVNPSLTGEPSTGSAHASLTNVTHSTSLASLRISTGSNASGYEFDEFRIGNTFAAVTPNGQAPPSGQITLRAASWNIYKGRGTDMTFFTDHDLDRTAATIASFECDLIGITEVMHGSSWGGNQEAVLEQKLETLTGDTWYSYWVPNVPGDDEGSAVLSKHPFVETSPLYMTHAFSVARVKVNIGGHVVDFYSTHLSHLSASYRAVQVSELMPWAESFNNPRHIIVGDFNAEISNSDIDDMTTNYHDTWGLGDSSTPDIAQGYSGNTSGRTRKYRIDFVFFRKTAPNMTLTWVQVPDTRDPSTFNGTPVGTRVTQLLNNSDDLGVRPSDHNPVIATFQLD